MIIKILTASQWAQFQNEGVFAGSPVDLDDGFIHFSTADQLPGTLSAHYAGQTDLVLVHVDPAFFDEQPDALRWEISRGGASFPHLYAPLPMEAVTKTERFHES